MSIIDRYLVRQFLRTFAIFFLSFTGLYVVVDTFSNLDDFLAYVEQEGNLLNVLTEYYGYRSLAFFNVTSGVLALIAAMFTVTGFQRTNELTALLAAGISKRRIVKPVLIAAALISVLAIANREFVVPRIRHELDRNAQSLSDDAGTTLKPRYDFRTRVFFGGARTFARDRRISKPALRLSGELAEYGDSLSAAEAYYVDASDDHPGGYLLRGVTQPKEIATRKPIAIDGETTLFTPLEHAWLRPDECFLASNVTFEHLAGARSWRQYASTAELISGLHNDALELGPDIRVAIHSRFVQPLLDVALLFLGLPIVLSRENRNVFLAIAMCGAIVLGFMLLNLACQALGSSGWLLPVVASWLPLFVCVPLAALLADPLFE
ncbi:MAG: LptF/LptG family permease [Pirellulales bacterium]